MKKIILLLLITIGLPALGDEKDLYQKIEILSEEMAQLKLNSSQPRMNKNVTLGGYGEWLFRNYNTKKDDNSLSEKYPVWDSLRHIIYFGYKFDDKFSFNSEIEVEHANEIYTEFAQIDYAHSEKLNFRAGLLLLPVGWVNEQHEPTTYLSANRPELEQKIIPTTWRENGFGVFGSLSHIDYKYYIVSGFDGSAFKQEGVRSGRQKGSKAKSQHLAHILRVDHKSTRGYTLGFSYYLSGSNVDVDNKISMLDVHIQYKVNGFHLRGLYTSLNNSDPLKLNTALATPLTGTDSVAEEMSGYYVEFGYDFLKNTSAKALIPFVRYEKYNTQNKMPTGTVANETYDVTNTTVGIAYHPIDKISLKLDYMDNKNAKGTGIDSTNFSLGYNF
jgi:hypothetical protein